MEHEYEQEQEQNGIQIYPLKTWEEFMRYSLDDPLFGVAFLIESEYHFRQIATRPEWCRRVMGLVRYGIPLQVLIQQIVDESAPPLPPIELIELVGNSLFQNST